MTRGKIFPLLVQGRRALYSRWQLSTLNGTLLNFSKLCELRLCRESQKPDNSNTTRSSGAISFRSFCSLFKFTSRGVKCFGLLCFFSFMKIAQNWILLWVIAACRYFFVSNEEKKSLFCRFFISRSLAFLAPFFGGCFLCLLRSAFLRTRAGHMRLLTMVDGIVLCVASSLTHERYFH